MFPVSLKMSVAGIALLAGGLSVQAQDRISRPGPAPTAVGDAIKLLYRVTGVRDNGAAATVGIATSFHCTNFSNVAETLTVLVRDYNQTLAGQISISLPALRTWTGSTHLTNLFDEDSTISPGVDINQGTAVIRGTSTSIICTAMIVDAAATVPQGIALHMVRFSAGAGSQE